MTDVDEMGLTPEAAQGYEQYFVPAIFDQWPVRIIDAAGAGEGHLVLEVGCGTGVLARELTKRVGQNGSVTGLDLSESMLGVARGLCSIHRAIRAMAWRPRPFGRKCEDRLAAATSRRRFFS